MNVRSLDKKIKATTEPSRIAQLLTVKNHYRICIIVRRALSISLLIPAAAILNITGITVFALSIGLGAGIAYESYRFYREKRIIKSLSN